MAHPLDIGAIAAARLTLSPLQAGEAEALRSVTSDPAVTAALPFLPEPFGRQQADALLARQRDGRDLYLGLRAGGRDGVPDGIAGGTLLGVLGVHLQGAARLEIGYWLPARFHGRGLASDAAAAAAPAYARAFPQRQLVADCRPGHAASRRVLEKAGFRATGAPGTRPGRIAFHFP